jgi:hypothetical protein
MDLVEICEELIVSVYRSSAKRMKNFNMYLVETCEKLCKHASPILMKKELYKRKTFF